MTKFDQQTTFLSSLISASSQKETTKIFSTTFPIVTSLPLTQTTNGTGSNSEITTIGQLANATTNQPLTNESTANRLIANETTYELTASSIKMLQSITNFSITGSLPYKQSTDYETRDTAGIIHYTYGLLSTMTPFVPVPADKVDLPGYTQNRFLCKLYITKKNLLTF